MSGWPFALPELESGSGRGLGWAARRQLAHGSSILTFGFAWDRVVGIGRQAKKRPSAVPAWFVPGLTGQRGEEPQSQEDWLSIIDTFGEISRPAEPCRKHIFWTEINYRDWSSGSTGSIGYYFLYFFGNPRFIGVFSSNSRIDKRNSWTYHTQYCWFASLFNVV
jgi:hypothetical protein